MKEELLEPLLRRARLAKALPIVRRYPDCILLDIGCGWEAKLLKSIEPYIARGVGIDRKAPQIRTEKLTTTQGELEATLPFASQTFDVVSMLAVLEHLHEPLLVLREVRRVLRPSGTLIVTVPSHVAKPLLEFLAYRLGVVNPREIADHKRYFGKRDLEALSDKAGLNMVTHKYFQFGFNNFAVFTPKTVRADPGNPHPFSGAGAGGLGKTLHSRREQTRVGAAKDYSILDTAVLGNVRGDGGCTLAQFLHRYINRSHLCAYRRSVWRDGWVPCATLGVLLLPIVGRSSPS